ncbi:unnamed protein product [Zymoseptoria tritici ST99CH_3D7]|uniref:Uncharacterized protein n=1 Tax=Zymoseptoria tritici (strain ST99CH_3D7) TaxID=1276538 RepID=A0A1X7SA46_ZYMT9|nr:unnamed protein product [Zymoseptoria tritici ST99CH_3D7]
MLQRCCSILELRAAVVSFVLPAWVDVGTKNCPPSTRMISSTGHQPGHAPTDRYTRFNELHRKAADENGKPTEYGSVVARIQQCSSKQTYDQTPQEKKWELAWMLQRGGSEKEDSD